MLVLNIYILDFEIMQNTLEFTPDVSSLAFLSGDIRISSLCAYKAFSTFVERTLQIHLFMQNEPNFRHFSPENDDYAKKRTQFKPNQSQFIKRQKMMQSSYLQRVKKINLNWGFVTTKPIKANNQSSLINNHLKGKPNSNPIFLIFSRNFPLCY